MKFKECLCLYTFVFFDRAKYFLISMRQIIFRIVSGMSLNFLSNGLNGAILHVRVPGVLAT